MRLVVTSIVLASVLSACQTATTPQTQTRSLAASSCQSGYQAEIAAVDDQIANVEKKIARGYQTSGGPVAIRNPLKLCKGIGPIAVACLPTPTIRSSLPTYAEYRAAKADLKRLEAQKAELETELAACGA